MQGEWQTGLVRIDALCTGDGIDKVIFLLDNKPILTKKKPPYNVEIDLGQVPRSRVLRVEAWKRRRFGATTPEDGLEDRGQGSQE